ncbi:hypothetical protein BDV93DRAFT_565514 [Ceratobasidium sp. AG-I]|nr:hypothetical protein BDV93DRAFT_565514 [Ceratobasidium sp. AG-I]
MPRPFPSDSDSTDVYCAGCAGHEDLILCAGNAGQTCGLRLCTVNPSAKKSATSQLRCVKLWHLKVGELTKQQFLEARKHWQCPRCFTDKDHSEYPHSIKPSSIRWPTHVSNKCDHTDNVCKRLRLVVIFDPIFFTEADAFAMNMNGWWFSHFWNCDVIMVDATKPKSDSIINTTEGAMDESHRGCSVVIALYLSPGGPNSPNILEAGTPCRGWQSVEEIFEASLPPHLLNYLSGCDQWRVVIMSNMSSYVQRSDSVVNLKQTLKQGKIKELVFPMRTHAGWNYGWMCVVVTKALMRELPANEEAFTAWIHSWIIDGQAPQEFNLVILDRKEGGASILYAPFETRPFSKPFPPIQTHRQTTHCVAPFRLNEPPTEAFFAYPRWVLTGEPIKRDGRSDLGSWRRQLQGSMIKSPSAKLKSAWACCSYCGFGKEVTLPKNGLLDKVFDQFFVRVDWGKL